MALERRMWSSANRQQKSTEFVPQEYADLSCQQPYRIDVHSPEKIQPCIYPDFHSVVLSGLVINVLKYILIYHFFVLLENFACQAHLKFLSPFHNDIPGPPILCPGIIGFDSMTSLYLFISLFIAASMITIKYKDILQYK